jgi:hypothetical protein
LFPNVPLGLDTNDILLEVVFPQLIIDRTNMPGRHWLGFEHAMYELQIEGSATRLTRTTTITSHLYPVWYWRDLERWGVASEHQYILQAAASHLRR